MFTREALLAAAETDPQGGALPRRFSGAAVESRAVRPGQLFIALVQDPAARQRAVAAAVEAGASAILATVPDPHVAARGVPQLAAADPLAVLRHLARDCVRRQPHTQIVAVVGGADAPATKDAIAALLAHRAPTLRMPEPFAGERSGEVDPLLALVNLELEHGYAVLTLGVHGPDATSIASLCRLIAPRIGVVTSLDSVPPDQASVRTRQTNQPVRSATDLLRILPDEGVAVLDASGRHARHLTHQTTARVVTYGRRVGVDVRALRIVDELTRGTRFTLATGDRQVRVQLGISGERAVTIALAAAAVALQCGLPLDVVPGALSELRLPKSRGAVAHDLVSGGAVTGRPQSPVVAASIGQSEPRSQRAAQ